MTRVVQKENFLVQNSIFTRQAAADRVYEAVPRQPGLRRPHPHAAGELLLAESWSRDCYPRL